MKNLILKWFKNNYNNLIDKMIETNHHHSNGSLNPYHLEGNVWIHTNMVLDLIEEDNIDQIFAALLHDIGKVNTRLEKDNGKVSFRDHENVSSYLSIDILKKAKLEFKELNIVETIKLIAWHGTLWNHLTDFGPKFQSKLNYKFGNDKEFFYKLVSFVEADFFGRTLKNENEIDEKMKIFDFLYNFIPYNTLEYAEKRDLEVICLVGISGSGKSTWIKNSNLNYQVVSVDKYLEKGKMDYNYVDYDKKIKKAHDSSLKDIKNYIDNKDNVIIDMTNTSKETRRKKLSKFPSTQYSKKAIVFLNGVEGIKKNLKNRENTKKIDFSIIERQIKTFELPNYDEFDQIEYIL